MDYADFVRQIRFRLLQPGVPRPAAFRALHQFARKTGIHLDMWMTVLPEGHETMQRRLRRVCRMRRRSTFAIGAIVNRGVEQLAPGQVFVSVGIGDGFTLLAAMSGNRDKLCIGVDLVRRESTRRRFIERFDRWKSRHHEFHEQDFHDYFAQVHQKPIGFCACTGPMTHRSQLDALRLAEPFLADAGFFLIEDANDPDIYRAVVDFQKSSSFEYSVLLDVRTHRAGHPTFWNGVILLQRGLPKAARLPDTRADRRAA